MSKFPKILPVAVTQGDIDDGECRMPNKCMLKLAIKREIGGHGYVDVRNGTVSITRRPDYREKGFLPRSALKAMLDFDVGKKVKPFRFKVVFYKTTKIKTAARLIQAAEANRKIRARPGYKAKKYTMRQRIAGIAVGDVIAA